MLFSLRVIWQNYYFYMAVSLFYDVHPNVTALELLSTSQCPAEQVNQ